MVKPYCDIVNCHFSEEKYQGTFLQGAGHLSIIINILFVINSSL